MQRKFIKFVLVSLVVLLSISENKVFATSPGWGWVSTFGGQDPYEGAASICRDNNDNIYLTGAVSGPTAFFNTAHLTVSGINDIFLAKFDKNGNELWVKCFGGVNSSSINIKSEGGHTIKYDSVTQSIILLGSGIGTFSVDSHLVQSHYPQDRQIFLGSFDTDGNCRWAFSMGSQGDDLGGGLTLTGSDIYVAMTLRDSAIVDSAGKDFGCTLMKVDRNGSVVWTKKLVDSPGGQWNAGLMRSVYSHDEFIYYAAIKNVDTLIVDTVMISSTGNYCSVIAKMDTAGNFHWVRQVGGPASFAGYLTVDLTGEIYFGGYFAGSIAVFGSDTIHTSAFGDFYLAKYDSSGNFIWVRHGNSSEFSQIARISTRNDGRVYLTGSFKSDVYFNNQLFNASTSEDFFVACYDRDGNCLGVVSNGQGIGSDVLADDDGCIVAGVFMNSMQFINPVQSVGYNDMFIARIDNLIGLDEVRSPDNTINIFPNPSTGIFYVDIPLSGRIDEINVEVFNSIGDLVRSISVGAPISRIEVSLSGLADGMYYVKFKTSNKMFFGKVMISERN